MYQWNFRNYLVGTTRLVAIPASLLFLAFSASAADVPSWKLIPDVRKNTVWRVDSNGAISTIDFPLYDKKKNSGIFIESYPLPSPDQRKIAYVKSNDLWVYDFEKNEDRRLTNVGQPEDEKFASVFVTTVTWSSDSNKILIRVLSGLTEPELMGHGQNWKKEKREAEFGTRVVDLGTRSSSSIEVQGIPDSAPVWLPNGKFLVVAEGATYGKLDDELHLYDAANHESHKIVKERGWYSRPVVSADGRWALVSAGQGVGPDLISPGKDLRSQIKKIDLENGKITDVTQLGRWGEFYFYAISPGGSGTAYFWKKSTDPNSWRGSIVVNGQELYPCEGIASVIWINERTIAINSRSELAILDIISRKTIGARRH